MTTCRMCGGTEFVYLGMMGNYHYGSCRACGWDQVMDIPADDFIDQDEPVAEESPA